MVEEVMDPNVKITNVPDVEESTDDWDANWDKNKVIRDVAYYIRAHKFEDFDRRYYRRLEDSPSRFYQEFPKPPLRSLHWEVRRHCDASFVECLRYLERNIKLTALRREDDTITIMKEQNWNLEHNIQQVLSAQKDCQDARRRDDLTAVPFQELSIFGEPCDNHANCDINGGNGDPRADDTKPYACALYSFCPDHCCPMKQIGYMTDCYHSPQNPCYAENMPSHRECKLNRQENQDLLSLVANQINISCQCLEKGYEWSARFGICVDVNECTRGRHDCLSENGELCVNMPGGYECVCKFGYVYDSSQKTCIVSSAIEEVLAGAESESNVTKTRNIIEAIINTITRSTGNRLAINCTILLAVFVSLIVANNIEFMTS
ncbi:Fibulin-2 [Dufourea novaeangliae]|uniref:Fibulin-2 n=1 Tax=Dufourea novaeangliae TaxID=178035 RepID=A0A154P4I3_DUFNO|nr:Fibulin-2 [Dufourea novaeangliae]